MKTIKTFLGICEHQYKTTDKFNLYQYSTDKLPYATKFIQECEKCKKMRSYKL